MAGNRVLEFIVRAKDKTSAGLKASGSTFEKFRARMGRGAARLAKRIFSVRTAMAAVTAVAAGLGYALKTAFEFERYQTQFKVLFGDIEQAKAHIADLQAFAAETPFQFAGIAQASRQLHVLTGGIMGAKESLTLVGDAAAAVGTDLGELSTWVGRAYGAIKAGRPFGEAAMRLMELGILTPEVRAKMEDLQAAGESNAKVWGLLQGELKKFEGGMKELSQTGEGLFSTLKDNWKQAVAEFGKVFMDTAKNDIGSLTDALKSLRENGDIAVWATRMKEAIDTARQSVGALIKGIEWIYKLSGASDLVANIKGSAAAIGALSTGDFDGAAKKFHQERVKGFYGGKINDLAWDPHGARAANEAEDKAREQREGSIRYNASQRHKRDTEEQADKKASLDERIAEDLARAQEARDKEAAQKKAEEEKKAREKAQKELQKQQREEMRKLVAEEKRLRREAIDEHSEAQQAQSAMQTRIARARTEADQALNWFMDPGAYEDKLEQDKARERAAEEALKLGRRMETVIRPESAMSARERAALQYARSIDQQNQGEAQLKQIEANTRGLAEELRRLMAMK